MIDWFTVCAQALNFVILVWLMKRYLYKPILAAIDARETRIAAELADAAAKQAEAKKEREAFQQKNDAFDQQRAALLSKATDEASFELTKLLEAARQAADAWAAKRAETMSAEAHALNQAVGEQMSAEVFAVARKTLAGLADVRVEGSIVRAFSRRVRTMDATSKASIQDAMNASVEPPVVRSAFELPADERAELQRAMSETFSTRAPLTFQTATSLIGGIELTAGDQKLAWSIADYVGSMQARVTKMTGQSTPTKES